MTTPFWPDISPRNEWQRHLDLRGRFAADVVANQHPG